MLSRSAQSLYWMGRYLERAEHLCRLLQLQVEALVDRPLSEIYFGWSRLYAGLSRQPPGGDLESEGSDDYILADSYTLAGDLTFERDNSDSVRNCFAFGRENARQVRHCISAEMWTCLNLAWLRICDLDIEDIWKVSPENFYAETTREINTFTGVAEATMYRDEGWRFMRLGRFIERAQLGSHCSSLSSRPAAPRAKPRTRTGRACCVRAKHSMRTNAATASRSSRTKCWICSSLIPCCPARCAAYSTRWRRNCWPSARARTRMPGRRPSGSLAGCAP